MRIGLKIGISFLMIITLLTGCSSNSKTIESNTEESTETTLTSKTSVEQTSQASVNLKDYLISGSDTQYSLKPLLMEDSHIVTAALKDQGVLFIEVQEADGQSGIDIEGYDDVEITISELSLDTGKISEYCSFISKVSEDQPVEACMYKIVNTSPLIYYDQTESKMHVFSEDYSEEITIGYNLEAGDGGFDYECVYSSVDNSIYYMSPITDVLCRVNYEELMELAHSVTDTTEGMSVIDAKSYSEELRTCEYGIGYKDMKDISDDGTCIRFSAYDTISDKYVELLYNVVDGTYVNSYEMPYDDIADWSSNDDKEYIVVKDYDKAPSKFNMYDYNNLKSYVCNINLTPYTEKKEYGYSDYWCTVADMGVNDKYVLFAVIPDGGDRMEDYILWNYTSAKSKKIKKDLQFTQYEFKEETDYGKATKKATELEEKYGINIVMGKDVTDQIPDYSAETVLDKQAMIEGLKTLEDALDNYPDGFIKELTEGRCMGLNIYLTGLLTPNDSNANVVADGVTNEEWGYQKVAINILGESVGPTVLHEMSHVIDAKLENDGVLSELDKEWSKCNPEGFSYYESYIGYDGDYVNTSYDDDYWTNDDPEVVYFFDDYSKTYAKEDRARLIEHFNDWGLLDDCYASSHIQDKLKVYWEYLSDNFQSVGDIDDTYWGKLMAKLQ